MGKKCHFEFGPDLVLRKKSGLTQDLGKINYFEFSPDWVLTFYSGLGQVLILNSGPSQDPDSGPTQDSGPNLRRSVRIFKSEINHFYLCTTQCHGNFFPGKLN